MSSTSLATVEISPFGLSGSRSFAVVADGLGNTAFLAEILQGRDGDARGFLWSSMPGGSSYMSIYNPNQFNNIYKLSRNGDLLMDPDFCVSEPGQKLPCDGDPASIRDRSFSGARSHHYGGINTLMGDGSVRFVKETINHRTWIALNSMAGGETIDLDSF